MKEIKIDDLLVRVIHSEGDFMVVETDHEYRKSVIEVLPMWKPVGSPTVDLDKLDFENWEKGLCTRHGLFVRESYTDRWWVWQEVMRGWATREDHNIFTATVMIRDMEFSWPGPTTLLEAVIRVCFPFPLNTAG